MKQISRDKIKVRGFKRFKKSFSYSLDGLKYAYKYEQSMFIHFMVTIFVLVMGFICELTLTEWAIVLITIGVVLASELINTAIEAVVDLVTLEIHPLAKIAKDCGSAATFVLSIIAAFIGIAIFVPHLVEMFRIIL